MPSGRPSGRPWSSGSRSAGGLVRVPRQALERLPHKAANPPACISADYLQLTRFESIAERKLRRRQLTEDGDVEISGRDLR
jgi:hypothetical protein